MVEDDPFIAMDVESLLRAHGWRILGPAHSIAEALALLDQQIPDLALLDVEIDPELVVPVTAALQGQGVPFVLCSARPPSKVPPLAGATGGQAVRSTTAAPGAGTGVGRRRG
ncbi:response regulator [Geminicoccus flavidas]|uniref:response regulator n=1 Tax=Geminicoccus flavidas TaxID=2506407 RepID=UPI00190F46EF|nr:hypothetical protein [Geminicoccus flavidas]